MAEPASGRCPLRPARRAQVADGGPRFPVGLPPAGGALQDRPCVAGVGANQLAAHRVAEQAVVAVPLALRVERDEEDLVRLYLTDIGQYPLLTKDDEVRLAQAIEARVQAEE